MDAHKTVFTARSEAAALGMERQGVDGSEMALDATKLVRINGVKEADFEFTRSCRRCCDLAGFLTTAQNDLARIIRCNHNDHDLPDRIGTKGQRC